MSLTAEETQVQVSYDGNVIIPTSRFSIARQYERSGDGTKRRKGWSFNLSGLLLAFKGSPNEYGEFHQGPGYPDEPDALDVTGDRLFNNLQIKIKALSSLFEDDGKLLIVTPPFGSQLKIRPRWNQLQYPEGPWVNNIKWDISGECDFIEGIDEYKGELPEESWSLEHVDEVGRVYKLTHSVQAQARAKFNSDGTITPGWEVAKGIVLGNGEGGLKCVYTSDIVSAAAHSFENGQPVRVKDQDTIYYIINATDDTFQLATTVGGSAVVIGSGTDTIYIGPVSIGVFNADLPNRQAPNVLDLSNSLYNYFRSENINESGGSYSVTEMWTSFDNSENLTGLTGGAAIEDFNVETKTSADTGLTTVQLNGSIAGLEIRNNVSRALISGRWACALARATGATDTWAYSLANSISGITINPTPISRTISRNTINGVYGYSYAFDTRPATSNANILTELITVEFDNAVPIIAQIPVPNRAAGPILQDPNTVTQQSVTVSYDIAVKVNYGVTPTIPTTNPYAEAIAAIGSTPSTIYMVKDLPRWTKTNGKYSRTTTFIYQA